jgi:hypothetical protein
MLGWKIDGLSEHVASKMNDFAYGGWSQTSREVARRIAFNAASALANEMLL